MFEIGFKCIKCKLEIEIKNIYLCPKCSSNLDILYNYSKIKKISIKDKLKKNDDFSIWRYLPFFPVKSSFYLPTVGWTPLYEAKELARSIGLKNLFVKDDTKNPSASLKDRASAVFLARAIDLKEKIIVGASTGNAGSSTACLSAPLGIKPVIFFPRGAPREKLTQLLVFGAKAVSVNGTYDDAFSLSIKATEKFGWYNRNTGFNPFTREGKKSVSFEICEQLKWNVPDFVVVPIGDGNIISGVWKGFNDFYKTGLIDKMPKLIGVQAEKSSSVANAFIGKKDIEKVSGDTLADSISVGLPKDGYAALKALEESSGTVIKVDDLKILQAIREIARFTGIFVEPAASAAFAGLKEAIDRDVVGPDHKVVIILTGSGLKDINNAMKTVSSPLQIDNSFEEFEKKKDAFIY